VTVVVPGFFTGGSSLQRVHGPDDDPEHYADDPDRSPDPPVADVRDEGAASDGYPADDYQRHRPSVVDRAGLQRYDDADERPMTITAQIARRRCLFRCATES
jgi:hypothetical protein